MDCPVCSSQQTEIFHNKVWGMENGSVYSCVSCGLTFINPIMTDEQEAEFYANYNAHAERRGFISSNSVAELHQRSKPIAEQRYDIIKGYFADAQSILEVGTSTGAFLEQVTGKDCYGVEPTPDNREFSKTFCKDAFTDIFQVPASLKFDVICMFHVFEHIKKPFEFLNCCSAHLNEGGKIIVEVPCIDDPLISMFECKAYKDFYFQPMHPFVYSEKSIRHVFEKSGFKNGQTMHYQRYGLDNHLTWLSKGIPGGDKLYKELFGNLVDYKKTLEAAGKTDTIFFISGL